MHIRVLPEEGSKVIHDYSGELRLTGMGINLDICDMKRVYNWKILYEYNAIDYIIAVAAGTSHRWLSGNYENLFESYNQDVLDDNRV